MRPQHALAKHPGDPHSSHWVEISRKAIQSSMPHGHVKRAAIQFPVRGELNNILCEASKCTLGRSAPPIFLLEFDSTRFKRCAFAEASIACPESVARSVNKRQSEFLFGRMAARLAVSNLKNAPVTTDIGIGTAREPLWPQGVIGSITHSDRFAAAAALHLGASQGLGIDIEPLVSAHSHDALLATVLDKNETAMLDKLACKHWPPASLLTAAFSAKESLFKGAFRAVGRYFDFSAVRWTGWDCDNRRLRLTVVEPLSSQFNCGREFTIDVSKIDDETLITRFLW